MVYRHSYQLVQGPTALETVGTGGLAAGEGDEVDAQVFRLE